MLSVSKAEESVIHVGLLISCNDNYVNIVSRQIWHCGLWSAFSKFILQSPKIKPFYFEVHWTKS